MKLFSCIGTGTDTRMQATPANAYFFGVGVGTTKEVIIRVVNKGQRSVRMKLCQDVSNSTVYQVYMPHLGLLAPGMIQTVFIRYTPDEQRVCSDSIQIDTEGDTLVIPIYSFPIKNTISIQIKSQTKIITITKISKTNMEIK